MFDSLAEPVNKLIDNKTANRITTIMVKVGSFFIWPHQSVIFNIAGKSNVKEFLVRYINSTIRYSLEKWKWKSLLDSKLLLRFIYYRIEGRIYTIGYLFISCVKIPCIFLFGYFQFKYLNQNSFNLSKTNYDKLVSNWKI